jgi:hypothetical protein
MKNFVQSGEWALTVIAPTGGCVPPAKVPADALAAGAIAKVDPATGIVGAAITKSIGLDRRCGWRWKRDGEGPPRAGDLRQQDLVCET